MNLKALAKEALNGLLKSLGYILVSLSDLGWQKQRYSDVVSELCGLYENEIFPELPPVSDRSKLLCELKGTTVSEAIFLISYLHQSMRNTPGDICEFGVAQGCTSALLANEIHSFANRDLWLFDSFKGLSKPTAKDVLQNDIFNLGSMHRYEGTMAFGRQLLHKRLESSKLPAERIHITEGFIEQLPASTLLPKQICFAYIDFDLYQPILTALMMVHPLLGAGGCLVIDDYGFFSTGAKSAVDEFYKDHEQDYEFVSPPSYAGHFCLMRKL